MAWNQGEVPRVCFPPQRGANQPYIPHQGNPALSAPLGSDPAPTFVPGENFAPLPPLEGLSACVNYQASYVPGADEGLDAAYKRERARSSTRDFVGAIDSLRKGLQEGNMTPQRAREYLEATGFRFATLPDRPTMLVARRDFGPILTNDGKTYAAASVYLVAANGKTLLIVEEPVAPDLKEGNPERQKSWIVLSGTSEDTQKMKLQGDSAQIFYAVSNGISYVDTKDWAYGIAQAQGILGKVFGSGDLTKLAERLIPLVREIQQALPSRK